MRSKRNTLFCEHCGNTAEMDHYGFLAPAGEGDVVFQTPPEWYAWQKEQYFKSFDEDSVYTEPCKIFFITDSGKYVPSGEGEFHLSRDVFRYIGTCEGKETEYTIKNCLYPNFSNEIRGYFNIEIEGRIFAIQPCNSPAVFKVTILKEIFSEPSLLQA